MVLARAARADMEASERERALIATILQQHAGLSADQADLVTELVTHRQQLFGASEAYLATREFRRLATAVELECILRCLFAVCAADDSIALVEEEEVRQVASELGFTHEQFVAARSAFRPCASTSGPTITASAPDSIAAIISSLFQGSAFTQISLITIPFLGVRKMR